MAALATLSSCNLTPKPLSTVSYRFIRARWERPYLKDLYHRRMIAGADPLLSRAVYPNWNYQAEMYAFSHRIRTPELNSNMLMQLLTDKAFYTRPDVTTNATGAQANNQYDFGGGRHNEEFIDKGANFLSDAVHAMLRFGMPQTPEELIEVLTNQLLNEKQLAKLARSLGMDQLIRTAEFPPSDHSLCRAFHALIGAISYERAIVLIQNVIIPSLCDIDIEEAFPLAEPYTILSRILSTNEAKAIEPRILRSTGVNSAEPLFIVGIYADRQLFGQAPGETIKIAIDMASMVTLFRLWGLTSDKKFPFSELNENFDLETFRKPNFSLSDIMDPSFSLKFVVEEKPPLDVKSVAYKYKTQVEAVVGRPLRRRLRHKFSRGSWGKRYFRYVMKPRVYTIC